MEAISKALDIPSHPEIDLLRVQEQCHQGTCGWLTENPGFQKWLGSDDDRASITSTPEISSLDTEPRTTVPEQPPPQFL